MDLAEEFLRLYDRYFDDIYRYIYFKVGNKWDVDDIVSEVFVRAYQHMDARKTDQKAWLFAIARNAVVDFYRKSGREMADENIDKLEALPFEESIEEMEEMNCLGKALQSLDEDQREIIALRYFAGLKYSQIAELLNIQEGAAKMRIHRILEHLKEMVGQCLKG